MSDTPNQTCSTSMGPICPYCKHENDSAGSDYWAEREGDGVSECDECGRTYKFTVDYTTYYYAEPAD